MVLFGESANMASKAREFDFLPFGFLKKRSSQSKPFISTDGMRSEDSFSSSVSTTSSAHTDTAPMPKAARKKLRKQQNKPTSSKNDTSRVPSPPLFEDTARKRFSFSKYIKGEDSLLQRLKLNYSDTALVSRKSKSVLDLSKNQSAPVLSSLKGEDAPSTFRLNYSYPRTTPRFTEADYDELMTGAHPKTDSTTTTLAATPASPERRIEGEVTPRRLGQLKGMLNSHHRDYMSSEQIGNIQKRIKEMETELGTPLETRLQRLKKYRDNPKFNLSHGEQNRVQARIDELEAQLKQKPKDKTKALLDEVSKRLNAEIQRGAIDDSLESTQRTMVNTPGYQTPSKLATETPTRFEKTIGYAHKAAASRIRNHEPVAVESTY